MVFCFRFGELGFSGDVLLFWNVSSVAWNDVAQSGAFKHFVLFN